MPLQQTSTDPKRRQNSSCDPCRRSKRRCVLPGAVGGQQDPAWLCCVSCQNLGHQCTFDFAKRRRTLTRSSRRQDESSGHPAFNDSPRHGAEDISTAPEQVHAAQGYEGMLSSWYNPSEMDVSGFEMIAVSMSPVTKFNTVPGPDSTVNTEAILPHLNPILHYRRNPTKEKDSSCHVGTGNPSLSSPVNLLNSSVNSNTLDQQLCQIYNTILTNISFGFLNHGCNPLNPKCSSVVIQGSPMVHQLDATADEEEKRARKVDQGILEDPMTILGIVNFLDNFGNLYGNRLTSSAIQASEKAFLAVVRAFTMQWLPSQASTSSVPPHGGRHSSEVPAHSGTTSISEQDHSLLANQSFTEDRTSMHSPIFIECWFKARQEALNVQSIRSFKTIYTLFLFHMIAVPTEMANFPEGAAETDEFLEISLAHLQSLKVLLTAYCNNLGPTSVYGNLLRAGLQTICWFGYLRDTTTAFTTDRVCILSDWSPAEGNAHSSVLGLRKINTQHLNASSDIHDADVEQSCSLAATHLIFLWRRIVRLRDELRTPSKISSIRPQLDESLVAEITTIINSFEEDFQSFVRQGLQGFDQLSSRTASFLALIVLLWNYGIMKFAEQLTLISNETQPLHSLSMASRAKTYLWTSAQSMAVIAKTVRSSPSAELHRQWSWLSSDIPMVSFHATSDLVVKALVKAIESMVEIHPARNLVHGIQLGDSLGTDSTEWNQSTSCLLDLLSSMETTMWGSYKVRAALDTLMQKHGDILLESWLPRTNNNFDVTPQVLDSEIHNDDRWMSWNEEINLFGSPLWDLASVEEYGNMPDYTSV